MTTTSFDAIVIGAGQAGPFLAVKLAQAGMKTALIEREHLGGTCVNDGCIPTKTLVASARAAHVVRRAADFGVRVDGAVSVDMKAVKARKDRIVGESVDGLAKWLGATLGLTLVWGRARFTGPRSIEVNGATLEAPQIFINVGGRPVLPPWPGIADVPVLTNTTMMGVDTLPEHLIIAGGSYIGLEFAQMYRRFGSRVTVVEYGDRLISREDVDVSREVQAILEREGVACHFSVKSASVSAGAGGKGVRVALGSGGSVPVIEGSHLLAAVGRRPNSDDLGLDKAGIAVDSRGYIVIDDELRTSVRGVWALGDVNGHGAFTHTSFNDHEIVADNLLRGTHRRVSDRLPTYALFIDPPLGRVGMNEAEVRARGKPALVGVMPMTRVGRARERGETQGFMKIHVDAGSERILGASLLGIEGDEIVHALLDIMAADVSYKVVERAVHIHPTVSELIPTLLGQLVPLAAAP
ncbi:MAG TPA: FAD-containing oxidoreductase [Caldimonas sp.]|jgi:pyruvate/2-oxoglutarate dehydrogenase complex dihydrolipoamide dehydrogenase (E3) component|nr:FAD-containing oxidoreductase [Caldimonas sp.]HEV7576715.1 FAD-containing oxidoreductase [Caldimonas sp.]